MLRLAEQRLLAGLELVDPVVRHEDDTPVVRRARRAATVRQARLRAVR